MGTRVVSLLFCVTFVSGLYDGRDGRAIDFGKRTGSRQPFVLSDLTPQDNEVVNTQFSVLGLDILDSLPPVNINQQNFINHQQDVNSKRKHQPRVTISRRPSPGFHAEAQPAVPATNPTVPSVAAPPAASAGGRNVFNFQPFPNVFNPWRNFYNFANFQPQVTPPPSIERGNNRKSRRRQSTTPRTTPSTTKTPTTTTSTTTTTSAPVEIDYDYQYYDFNTNSLDKTDYNHDERKVYTNDDETEDYPYKNDISEYTDDHENDFDYSDTSVYGCPGSLRECLDACSPVISINNAAYKICVNECLDRC